MQQQMAFAHPETGKILTELREEFRSGKTDGMVIKNIFGNLLFKAGTFLLILCMFSGCGKTQMSEVVPASVSGDSSREYVTEEEIYQQALELLCYGDADYRQNKAAKDLLEIIRGYKDSEKYLDQIYEVCTRITGERIVSEFVYDEYGHVRLERGNPYYTADDGQEKPDAVTYIYSDGKIKEEIYPEVSVTAYTYDDAGRISQMEMQDAGGDLISYTYRYETDEEGRIIKRTAWAGSEKVGERTSEYQIDIDGIMTVLQHEESAMRKPSGKDRLLTFNKRGHLVRVDNETNFSEYSYGYVWMPKHDPDEEFVYEHRIQMAYF